MLAALFTRFSLSGWFFEAWTEMVHYFNAMNTIQWGVVSACAVTFGFMCLKGTGIHR